MDIPRIYHGYMSNDIPWISMDIPRIYLVDIHGISMDIPRISTPLDIHGIFMDIQVYPMYIGQDGIYMGYTWGIVHGISHVYTENRGSRCKYRVTTRSQSLSKMLC